MDDRPQSATEESAEYHKARAALLVGRSSCADTSLASRPNGVRLTERGKPVPALAVTVARGTGPFCLDSSFN